MALHTLPHQIALIWAAPSSPPAEICLLYAEKLTLIIACIVILVFCYCIPVLV